MTQQQKQNELAEWLEAHGINFYEPLKYNDPKHTSWYDRGVRLVIPQKRIAVVVCKEENENSVYELLKKSYIKAFFVRESEDLDFIFQKMQNCLKGWTVKKAKEEAKAKLAPPHRKRERIHVPRKPVYEKVTPKSR